MKKHDSASDRAALVALLERFNLSIDTFDALRSDSYEQQLARHSLEHLELLYVELLKPGQSLAEAREKCPPMPPGNKTAGTIPTIGVMQKISERLRTEQTLNSLGRVSGFLDTLRNRAKSLPIGQQTEVLDTLVTLVGEEMLQAKLGGAAVSGNLDPLDRLLAREDQKRKDKEWQLKREQWLFDASKACLAKLPELKAIASDKGLSDVEKIQQVRLKLFGVLAD